MCFYVNIWLQFLFSYVWFLFSLVYLGSVLVLDIGINSNLLIWRQNAAMNVLAHKFLRAALIGSLWQSLRNGFLPRIFPSHQDTPFCIIAFGKWSSTQASTTLYSSQSLWLHQASIGKWEETADTSSFNTNTSSFRFYSGLSLFVVICVTIYLQCQMHSKK